MKASILALAASAVLAAAQHAHHHERRHEQHLQFHPRHEPKVCGCTTTTWYGEPTLVPVKVEKPTTTPCPSSSAAPVVHTSTSTPCPSSSAAPVAHKPKPSPYAAAKVAKKYKPEPPKKKPAPAPAKKYTPSAPKYPVTAVGGTEGSQWALTFTPYGGNGHGSTWCKSASEIASEVAQIAAKNFKVLRLYSADDCNQLEAVHAACKQHGLKLIVGVFFKDSGACEADMESQLTVIKSHFGGNYADVELITIGNECISSGTCQAGQLAGLISSAKETLQGAGYHGPVSTALIVSDWQENGGELCSVVDLVAAQIHPFFSAQPVQPGNAASYFESQYDLAAAVCHGKPTLCTETGWPHAGGSYQGQTAGPEQQAAAIKSLRGNKYVGKTTFFSNSDDLWKAGQEAYEMYFGCLDQF